MQEQLLKLLNALALIGYTGEDIYLPTSINPDEYLVSLQRLVSGAEITITISKHWVYADAYCYFVNYSPTNGDFLACTGTPFIEQALVDIGRALNMASYAKTKD